ncbi:hypothetical protein ACLB2K_011997 [Fragaria x ananassa]
MLSLRLPLFHYLHRTTSPLNPTRPFLQICLQSRSLTTQPILNDAVTHEFRFFRVYESGRVEKFHQTHKILPKDDPVTGVRSKDVVISSEPAISARVFLPQIRDPTRKLPVLFHVHGGGFSFESAFSPHIHNYVSTLSSEADVIAVSVEYRLAPEHPIPACYDDPWAALNWVSSHCNRNGPEPWLNEHADFERVFVAGDSAGGNISHDLAVRDCRLRPSVEDLRRLGCERVLVFVAEKDHLNGVGKNYVEELRKSGWEGSVEIVENEGEDHCFHLEDLKYEKAVDLIRRFASFIKHQ